MCALVSLGLWHLHASVSAPRAEALWGHEAAGVSESEVCPGRPGLVPRPGLPLSEESRGSTCQELDPHAPFVPRGLPDERAAPGWESLTGAQGAGHEFWVSSQAERHLLPARGALSAEKGKPRCVWQALGLQEVLAASWGCAERAWV